MKFADEQARTSRWPGWSTSSLVHVGGLRARREVLCAAPERGVARARTCPGPAREGSRRAPDPASTRIEESESRSETEEATVRSSATSCAKVVAGLGTSPRETADRRSWLGH